MGQAASVSAAEGLAAAAKAKLEKRSVRIGACRFVSSMGCHRLCGGEAGRPLQPSEPVCQIALTLCTSMPLIPALVAALPVISTCLPAKSLVLSKGEESS